MTLLIPDRDRENREDFIWCVPIERQKWNKWYKLSEKFKTVTPKEYGGVRYLNRMEGKSVKTILIMPNAQQSDDDAVTACAYLRMIKGMTCRMYVVRCTDDPLTGARLIERAAGADVTLVEDMELEGEEDESSAHQARCEHSQWYLVYTNDEGDPSTWGPENTIACYECGLTVCVERANGRRFTLSPTRRKQLRDELARSLGDAW